MGFQLEICAFNLTSAMVAQASGADRIELCASPGEGGVTPSPGVIRTARENLRIPLYPIIRPRGGDFLYSDEEFKVMLRDIDYCKQAGCNGVVIGMLNPDGSVDQGRCARLVEAAYPLGVTFHRAFDWAANPFEALEAIIKIGCERILTSGQRPTAEEGSELIDQLIREADDRIVIMPGSGVRSGNILQLAEKTGASEFHTSARLLQASAMDYVNTQMKDSQDFFLAGDEEIKKIKDLLISIS
ncbi:copper homeostasis protein CutC [Puia sp.]|jgi:copper homeostasis protein|uniref:copper homeostasis protein CutC n=1 Tax=Puia sp. TaxID=2045100 RepID=UPI002F42F960